MSLSGKYSGLNSGASIIQKATAIRINDVSMVIVRLLSKLLLETEGQLSEAEYKMLKRAVGMTIGELQVNILDLIYEQYPELSDID
ncbi:hypothetical protein [Snodgrassella sp. ESL0253]|uniref:hypothetical protein n=1 Tax=Snodgrassella sp. ESL0253 TaxID=2705031 RepID=UPI001582F7D3|nr:hypothetical protein [Snodgrassella sp. ESL0253]NUE67539.1 hypothetical protein [Snodgrassella sp. ESL0253]